MKWERMILIAFLGNYLVNNVAAGLASLVPASQGAANPIFTPQYLTFVVLALIVTACVAAWYLKDAAAEDGLKLGSIFGAVGFVTAVITAFITGVAGVLLQTGSASEILRVLPNFGPYLWNMTTVVLILVWIIPGALVGYAKGKRAGFRAPQSMSMDGGQSM